VPDLDLDVETSELQDPRPPHEGSAATAAPFLAAHDEEAMAIRSRRKNRHIVRLARLAPEGRARDLPLIFRGVDHVWLKVLT